MVHLTTNRQFAKHRRSDLGRLLAFKVFTEFDRDYGPRHFCHGTILHHVRLCVNYHLPNGHFAFFNLTFNGITHKHCLHCLVKLVNSGQVVQMSYLAFASGSRLFGSAGLSMSQGRVEPTLSLYLSQGVIFTLLGDGMFHHRSNH